MPSDLPEVEFWVAPEEPAQMTLKAGRKGVFINFRFKGGAQPPPFGLWIPTFEIQGPNSNRLLASREKFRVLKLETDAQRLNVDYFDVRMGRRDTVPGRVLKGLDPLLKAMPDHGALWYVKEQAHFNVGEHTEALEAHLKVIDLLKTGRSRSRVALYRITDREKVLDELERQTEDLESRAKQEQALKDAKNQGPEQRAHLLAEFLRSRYPDFQRHALEQLGANDPAWKKLSPEVIDLLNSNKTVTLRDGSQPLIRAAAWDAIRRATGIESGFDPNAPPEERERMIHALKERLAR